MATRPIVWRTEGAVPAGLSHEWSTTKDIAAAAGIPERRARLLLDYLRMRGVVQRTSRRRGDGAALWRIAPRANGGPV